MSWNGCAKAVRQAGLGEAQQSSSSPAAGGTQRANPLPQLWSQRDIPSFPKGKFKAVGGTWNSSGNGNIPVWLPVPPAVPGRMGLSPSLLSRGRRICYPKAGNGNHHCEVCDGVTDPCRDLWDHPSGMRCGTGCLGCV